MKPNPREWMSISLINKKKLQEMAEHYSLSEHEMIDKAISEKYDRTLGRIGKKKDGKKDKEM